MRSLMTNAVAAFASVALTTGIVAFADPANADVGTVPTRVIVRIGDLDLHSDAGRATAKRRIRRAAEQVCGDDTRDVFDARCRAHATNDAEQALDRLAVR